MLFLQILKIIGLVLLGIIGLVLFLAGLVLFVPVRYKLRGVKNEKEMSAEGEVYWLLKLVSVKVRYDKNGLRKKGRIAFFTFLKDDEPEKDEDDKPEKGEDDSAEESAEKPEQTVPVKEDGTEPEGCTNDGTSQDKVVSDLEINSEIGETPKEDAAKNQAASETSAEGTAEENTSEAGAEGINTTEAGATVNVTHESNSEKREETSGSDSEGTDDTDANKETDNKKRKSRKEKQEKPKKLTFVKRLKNLFINRDYVSRAIEKKRPAIDKSLKRVGKIIKHILPRKVYGRLEFGFEDPSTTGKVLGVIAALYGRMGELLKLYPDFQQKVLDCDLKIKGKIRIFTVLLLAALVYFKKDLRKLYKYLKHCTEVDIYEEYLEKQKEKDNGRK